MNSTLGATQDLYVTATGKSILAHQTQDTLNHYMNGLEIISHTPNTVKSKGELLSLLEKIREDGFSCDDEEAEIGLTCYAVPILSATGTAIAAISISGPTSRMRPRKDAYVVKLKESAKIIEGKIH